MKSLYKNVVFTLLVTLLASCASSPPPHRILQKRMMTVTAYCPGKKCCNWKRTWYGKPVYASGPHKGEYKAVGITASGKKARPGTVAADAQFPFGTMMYIPGYGKGVVEDRGSAIKGDHIDVFFKHHKDAVRWGKKRLLVTIYAPPGSTYMAHR